MDTLKEEVLDHINKKYLKCYNLEGLTKLVTSEDTIVKIFLKHRKFPKKDFVLELLKDHNNYISLYSTNKLMKSKKWSKIKENLFNTYYWSAESYKIIGIADENNYMCIGYYREAQFRNEQRAFEGMLVPIESIINNTKTGWKLGTHDIIFIKENNKYFDEEYELSTEVELKNLLTCESKKIQ